MEKYGGAREATDDNTIWRIRVACWISKATRARAHAHIHALKYTEKCVILIAFPRQQWFGERASRYMYVVCLVVCVASPVK